MRAIRLTTPGSPLEACELPAPSPGPEDLVLCVEAAGICHSDAHYRAGTAPMRSLPVTLGHEIAGTVVEVGSSVKSHSVGARVCVNYLATCGRCNECTGEREQFCDTGEMLGKDRDGGFAEYVLVPARSAHPLPDEVPFEIGAALMCSSSTALHALRKARLRAGESVAVFGAGGLGLSAVQLARALGAEQVFAVDIAPDRLSLAERLGATPIDARSGDPVERLRSATGGRGVDVALELIGLPETMSQSVRALARQGRAALAGISKLPLEVHTYGELIATEAEIIGVSDHLGSEIDELVQLARTGALDLTQIVTETVPLEAGAINAVLDRLDAFGAGARTVVVPAAV